MKKACPEKVFIPLPPEDSTCGCNDCNFMKLNTLEKLRDCLRDLSPEIEVEDEIAEKARRPILRMLQLSK
jgi:quinolinate synthase